MSRTRQYPKQASYICKYCKNSRNNSLLFLQLHRAHERSNSVLSGDVLTSDLQVLQPNPSPEKGILHFSFTAKKVSSTLLKNTIDFV